MTALYYLLSFVVGLSVGVPLGLGIASMVVRHEIGKNIDRKRGELADHIKEVDEIIHDIENLKENGRG